MTTTGRTKDSTEDADQLDVGRVVRVNGPLVEMEGLSRAAVLDVVKIGRQELTAEITSIRHGLITAQVYEYTGGLQVGDPAIGQGHPLTAQLGPGLLGGIFDGLLRPLNTTSTWLSPGLLRERASSTAWRFRPTAAQGQTVGPGAMIGLVPSTSGIDHRVVLPPGLSGVVERILDEGDVFDNVPVAVVAGREVCLREPWPVRSARPVRERLKLGAPLFTGQRIVDLLFPIAKGAAAAVPGGFGTGKTMLLQQLVRCCDADVVVFVGCGERGNELADALADLEELDDPRNGRKLLDRTVVIANTSNMPVMAREASIYTGMTVAEYYRDMGYDVVLLADSTSRWAEALREFSSRSGELPVEEGFPAGLASALAAFYERSGTVRTLGDEQGSVTVVGAVSPPGGDMTEPVTSQTERFVRCLWSLDRDLAYARHYPAITWRSSFARDVPAIGAWYESAGRPGWTQDRTRGVALLAEADRLAPMLELVGLQALPAKERIVVLAGRLLREAVLQQSALSKNDATCTSEKQTALLEMVLGIYDTCIALVTRDVAVGAIEAMDFSGVTRVRDEVGPDDADGVRRQTTAVLASLQALS